MRSEEIPTLSGEASVKPGDFFEDFVCAIPVERQTIKMGAILGEKVKAWWFDPRNGQKTAIGEFENSGVKSFDVPVISKELAWLRSGRGCDWVLILESVH